MNIRVTLASLLVATSAFASALIDLGTLDSSDGVSTLGGGYQDIYLSQASTGVWDGVSPIPGKGIYDPTKWAVIFKFSEITWTNSYLTIHPHPSGCPVIFLSQGNINLFGSCNVVLSSAVGGFAGGEWSVNGPGSAGLGPGGGNFWGGDAVSPGSYATRSPFAGAGEIYGNPAILPLIGGSGAAYSVTYGGNGGGGGGAVIFAARNTVNVYGNILANGANGGSGAAGGSGGAVKVIADTINSNGSAIQAIGGRNA